mmetsp:Transcript_2287/g.7710  ORF Transcript_2287/g.7710 Transcript_2287/m.7710 type:complete len:626 (+) Transcript_2287:3-1880(+)
MKGLVGTEEPPPFAATADRHGGAVFETGEFITDPVVLQRLLYPEGGECACFVPCVDDTTDLDGWIYASRAERLNDRRPGGRAGHRYGDRYRRRWWAATAEPLPAIASNASSSSMAGAEEERQRAFQSASQAFRTVFAGRGFHEVPLDPTAYLRRAQHDAAWYESLCARLPPWTDAGALGELAVAALYMRAAYGYVARIGSFDSVTAGAMVFSVQKAAFDIAEDVDNASHTHSFVDMLGLSTDDLVCTRWKESGAFRPAFAIARDHDMKWIVVAVRGTLSMKDVLTDMAAHNVPFLEGLAHEGFVQATQQLLAEAGDLLRSELAAHAGYRLVFCGHSMGGAVATLAVAMLRAEAAWAGECVAFSIGTPSVLSRCIGERLAQERMVFTAINCRDWSPRTSTSNVNEVLDHLNELSVLRTAMRVATRRELPRAGAGDPVAEQLPAGVVLQIAQPGDGSRGHQMAGPVLLAAEAVDYRHSMPVWPDVEAHIPIFYVKSLLQGLTGFVSSAPPQQGSKAPMRCGAWHVPVTAGPDAGCPPLPADGAPEQLLGRSDAAAPACGAHVLSALYRVAAARAPVAEEATLPGQPGTPAPALPRPPTPRAGGSHLPAEPDSGRLAVAECLAKISSP